MTSVQQNQQLDRNGFIENMCYSFVKSALEKKGIEINGPNKSDIQIKNPRIFYRFFQHGLGINLMGVGEGYMDGDWDANDLTSFFENMLDGNKIAFGSKSRNFFYYLRYIPLSILNFQSKFLSKQNVACHYDIGNDLFELMLDRSMNYSCAYWQKNVFLNSFDQNNNSELKLNTLCKTLDEAQFNKMLLIAKKLDLKPGMKVLDIGCGWGYLAKFLAINFDVHVVGITLSEEQIKYATSKNLKAIDLEFLKIPGIQTSNKGKFEFRLLDYRDIEETFDRIVSVGMFEHVGSKNYDQFFNITNNCLKDDGLFLLHTIGIGSPRLPRTDPWVQKYIFPGGELPYQFDITNASSGKFIIEDWHNLGMDYYRTLIVWRDNFEKSWPKIKHNYDERFRRMWYYYLCIASTMFKTRRLNLWQVVLSKKGVRNGYVSYR